MTNVTKKAVDKDQPIGEYPFTMLRPAYREDVIALLRKKQAGRPAYQLAEELGITASYLSDLFLGKKNPGPKLLTALGLTQKTIYQEVRQ